MSFFKFWPRHSGKASSSKKNTLNKDLLGGDLFCHLTHLSAVASSGLTRSQIFEQAAELPYMSSRYFREVHRLAIRLNYDYAEACRMVGETTKELEPRGLLLRLSGALVSGEPEAEFLAREAFVMGETYGNQYERSVEGLKKWTDAFIALILSAALVVVISAISMMIFPVPVTFVITLGLATLAVTVFGVWVLSRASPKEVKTHSLADTSTEQKLARTLFRISLPVMVVVCLLLLAMRVDLGWVMLVAAALLLPTGTVAVIDDIKVDRRDDDIAAFLRSLGGISKAIGSTLTDALSRIDFQSLHSLEGGAKRLYRRLNLGLSPELCWERFIGETGSEHVNRSVRIFWNGVYLGGDPQVVGNQSSMFALKVALLRARRRMVSSAFTLLCIVMHAAIAALLVCIYQIMVYFSATFEAGMQELQPSEAEAITSLPTFGFFLGGSQLDVLRVLTTVMIVVLTVTGALAIKVVSGGHGYKFLFFLGILLAVSGACFVLGPELISSAFGSLPTVQQ